MAKHHGERGRQALLNHTASTRAAIKSLIMECPAWSPPTQVDLARGLNDLGWLTFQGKPWTRQNVNYFMRTYMKDN